MGHALNNTLQDILCRFKENAGIQCPVAARDDHAGIATQNVVERELAAKGSGSNQVGREKFIELVWMEREVRRCGSSTSSSGWGVPATGAGSASPWMRACPER